MVPMCPESNKLLTLLKDTFYCKLVLKHFGILRGICKILGPPFQYLISILLIACSHYIQENK